MSDMYPDTVLWNRWRTTGEEDKRYIEMVNAQLLAEAVLHAADRITRAVDRLAQVRADRADKPRSADGTGDTPV